MVMTVYCKSTSNGCPRDPIQVQSVCEIMIMREYIDERITAQLAKHGFVKGTCDFPGELRYCRLSQVVGLYEQLWVSFFGNEDTCVASTSVISILSTVCLYEELTIGRFLFEGCEIRREFVEPDGEVVTEAYSVVHDESAVQRWLDKFLACEPTAVANLALSRGAELLNRTSGWRDAASQIARFAEADPAWSEQADSIARTSVGEDSCLYIAFRAACLKMISNPEYRERLIGQKIVRGDLLILSILADQI